MNANETVKFDREKSDWIFTETLNDLDNLNIRDGRFEYAEYVVRRGFKAFGTAGERSREVSRLTYKNKRGYFEACGDRTRLSVGCDGSNAAVDGDVVDRLAAYEDAEESGLLVVLPCKAGERWMRDGKQYIVAEISITESCGTMVRHYEDGNGEMLSCNPRYFVKHYTRNWDECVKSDFEKH